MSFGDQRRSGFRGEHPHADTRRVDVGHRRGSHVERPGHDHLQRWQQCHPDIRFRDGYHHDYNCGSREFGSGSNRRGWSKRRQFRSVCHGGSL